MDGWLTLNTNIECTISGRTFEAEHETELALDDLVTDMQEQLTSEQVHDCIRELDAAQGDSEFSIKLIRALLESLEGDVSNIHRVIEVLDNIDKADEDKIEDPCKEDEETTRDPYKGIGEPAPGVVNPQF